MTKLTASLAIVKMNKNFTVTIWKIFLRYANTNCKLYFVQNEQFKQINASGNVSYIYNGNSIF